ncbi:deoxyhypusine monooxygenase [Pancytospora epiphaga]|nr:deoxyhypusine monooxygenase [Pancytospora epiphaga]
MEMKENKEIESAVSLIKSNTTSMAQKMERIFYLRSLESPGASLGLQMCLSGDSILLDHEIAYVLGQMKQPNSIDFLLRIAVDCRYNEIVRHEAIEALGNFEDLRLALELEQFLNTSNDIVRESAVLAIEKLRDQKPGAPMVSRYGSRDPAFPFQGRFETALENLRTGNLCEKYRAMFFFRDLNTCEAVEALAEGFKDPSDLLRHEVAYVFGQMQNEYSCRALVEVLENEEEKDIVRHEAAEALGNIGTEECLKTLSKYLSSDVRILRESAEVGLGIASANFDKV